MMIKRNFPSMAMKLKEDYGRTPWPWLQLQWDSFEVVLVAFSTGSSTDTGTGTFTTSAEYDGEDTVKMMMVEHRDHNYSATLLRCTLLLTGCCNLQFFLFQTQC